MNSSIPSLTAKSSVLGAIAILLSLCALLDRPQGPGSAAEASIVASLNPDHVSRIELTRTTVKTVLERDPLTDEWTITSPIQHGADRARIAHLLAAFRRPILADVPVDSGNLKEYALDASEGVVVELWVDGNEPAASFTVGKDGPGGSNFVRVSGEDTIVRARIGGRQRFDRSPSDWRNRVVIDKSEPDIQGLRIEPWDGTIIHMVREPTEGETGDGPWAFDPTPGLDIPAAARAAVVERLGQMRAANILEDDFDGGFSPPLANITITDKDGDEMTLAIGRREAEGVAFVRVAGQVGVYAVPRADLSPFLGATAPVSSLQMFTVAESDIAKLIFYQRRTKVEISNNKDTGVWVISSPRGLTSDVADVQFAIRTLASPRASKEVQALTDKKAGLVRPRMVFEVQLVDGSNEAIFVGRHFKDEQGKIYFWVKPQGGDTILAMDEPTLSRLRRAFGQN
jgi:hypothetical protein